MTPASFLTLPGSTTAMTAGPALLIGTMHGVRKEHDAAATDA